jgi:predicted NAD-dependent protein-ADP-ribosyltransferase YbiA (DUF1768 family)
MSKDLDNVITFFSGKKEFRSLSNFWEKDVHINNNEYETGEHCFHGEKYIRLGRLSEDKKRKKELVFYGLKFIKPSKYKTGNDAKKMGGKKGLLLTPEELKLWDELSIEVQIEICAYKFNTYEEVRQDLVKSDNKILIHPALRTSEEKVKTRIWEGKAIMKDRQIHILGKNRLGNIWMDIKDIY